MTDSRTQTRFPWIAAALVVAVAGGATFCTAALPPLFAAPVAGALVLAAAALVWWAHSRRSPARLPHPSTVSSDSLPPGSDARMRLLESAVVHAHDAVAILAATAKDGLGRPVLYVNGAFCRLTGYAKEEILGRSLHLLGGPDSDPETLSKLSRTLDEGVPLRVELRNYRKNGVPFWVDLSAVPVPDEAGGISHWLIIQRDIDRRKSAERRARQTSQLLRAIIDAFPGPISAKDRDGRYLVLNQFMAELLGVTPDAAVGRTAAELTNAEHGTRTAERDQLVMSECKPIQYEVRYPAPNGDGRPWLTTKAPLWMPDGVDSEPAGARGVVTVALDISALKDAEDALRKSEELFRGIFENTSAGVSLTDAGGLFVSCNPAFAAMVGRSVEEVLRLTPASITHPDDLPGQLALMDEVRAGRRDRFTYPKRYIRPDGQVVWVELSFSAIRTPPGEYEYGLSVSVNVTERRELEDQLRQAQKMEAVGQMAGGVAHDFNNLLTAVLGNLSLVSLPEDDPNRRLLAAVEQAAGRAADLTGKLLGYARRNQLVFAPVEPRDALGEVVALLSRTLDPRIHLKVEASPDCPAVHADPTLLAQALMNLCLNSRDAMPDGGALTLSAAPVERGPDDPCPPGWDDLIPGRYVRLAVADTGSGMTDEVLARVFEPFFTTKGIGKGTGLGLPMVQGIVKQHHGWIEIHSRPGEGTRIELNLPTAEIATTPVVSSAPTMPLTMPTPVIANTPRPPKPPTILLVDDEPMIRDLGRAVLSRAGFRVLTAEDGAEAVEVFAGRPNEIDLVILDVTMPRMSGRDAYRHIARIDPSARILFSTGYTPDDLAEVDSSAGLLSKPYRPQELLSAVRAALAITPQPAG